MKQLLIVDDEQGSRQSLHAVFSGHYKVHLADSAKAAMAVLNDHRVDLVMLDYLMPDMDGVALLKEIQARYPDIPFVMVSASSTVRPVVDAMRAGAFDFVPKPFDLQEIRAVVARALEHSVLKRQVEVLQGEVARSYPVNAIIGDSPAMRQVLEIVQRVATTDTTALILGESGTGKELIARQLHSLSSRKDDPFIPIHCGSLPDTLMESELFGHERGAFTGADRRKPGRFDMAGSGTIFFDEISETTPATQVKLLRVIQEREYMRVGGTQIIRTNARLLAACNKDLTKEVQEGRFREDLYYRLNVIPITVPPIRERRDDIPLLINYFVHTFQQGMNIALETVAPETMELLTTYNWPGNVREMKNVIERAVVLHGHQRVLPPESLPLEFRKKSTTVSFASSKEVHPMEEPPLMVTSLQDAVADYERKLVERALREAGGIQTRAAEILGTTRRILKYRMDKLNILDKEDHAGREEKSASPPINNEPRQASETASIGTSIHMM